MQLPHGAIVAVADGSKLALFRNTDAHQGLQLEAMPSHAEAENSGAGARHQNSAANPSGHQAQEDDFAAGIATLLNTQVESGAIKQLFLIAAPRTLGELRKHFSKQVEAALLGDLAKDLTGHALPDIERAVLAA